MDRQSRSVKIREPPKVRGDQRRPSDRAPRPGLSGDPARSQQRTAKKEAEPESGRPASGEAERKAKADTTDRHRAVERAPDTLQSDERRTNRVDAWIEELTAQEVRDLKYVFDTFDNEHRGHIDAVDLRRALRALGFKVSQEDLIEMIADIHGGSVTHREVTFQQFVEMVVHKQADARDIHGELEQGFKMMDVGDKGHLTLDDLKRASQLAGLKFRESTIRDMMDEADTTGDELISKEEFYQVMLQTNLF